MPILNIHMMDGRTEEQKRNLVREVTKAVCDTLAVEADSVRIMLTEMKPVNYAVAGVLKQDKRRNNA